MMKKYTLKETEVLQGMVKSATFVGGGKKFMSAL